MGGDIKVEITWYSGNGRDISFRQQSIKEGLQKIDRQLTAKGKGGGEIIRIIESLGVVGGGERVSVIMKQPNSPSPPPPGG